MSVRFLEATDHLTYPGGAPNPASGFTFAGWVRPVVNTLTHASIARLHSAGGTAVTLATTASGLGGPAYFTGGGTVANSTGFDLTEWRYVAMTCLGSTATVYVSEPGGSFESDSGPVGGVSGPTAVTIGGRSPTDDSEAWNGSIQNARLWTSVLTEAELLIERQALNAVRTSGLWADWQLLTAADLTDHSGNGRHLVAGSTAVSTEDGPELAAPVLALTGSLSAAMSLSGALTVPAATVGHLTGSIAATAALGGSLALVTPAVPSLSGSLSATALFRGFLDDLNSHDIHLSAVLADQPKRLATIAARTRSARLENR